MTIIESGETVQARQILVNALKAECFTVQEEKVIPCTDNMGETINPPYSADIYASINFIIELDPESTHGGNHRTKKDEWRDRNIFQQYGIRTVRVVPSEVLKDTNLEMTFKEILSQLKKYST